MRFLRVARLIMQLLTNAVYATLVLEVSPGQAGPWDSSVCHPSVGLR